MVAQDWQGLSTMDEEGLARYTLLVSWLNDVISEQDFRVESLPGDASLRRYHRVYISPTQSKEVEGDNQGSQAWIVMDAPEQQESMIQFMTVAQLMADTVNVPDIVAHDIDNGFLMLEDFGTVEFAHLLVDAQPVEVDDYYQQAMRVLSDLQTIELNKAKKAKIADYDTALLMREMNLFVEWFLPHIGVSMTADSESVWASLTNQIVKDVLEQPTVLVHRDFHSRNLMKDAKSDTLGVIDFQDAVIGSYTYDLVSLLRDAYVEWDEEQIGQWQHDFWQMLETNIQKQRDYQQFSQDVMVMGLQRHLKVLGIFIRLSKRDNKPRYLADIPVVMKDLIQEMNWLAEHGTGDIKNVCLAFLDWFNQQVLPAYEKKFGEK